jgi:hypothetical protein
MSVQQHMEQAALADLRPTQMTVGAAEVAAKRAQWATLRPKARDKLLQSHWFPAVRGPRGRFYIVDHHHLGQALWQEAVKTVWVMPLADFSDAAPALFWRLMEFRQWAHPYDNQGRRHEAAAIPKRLAQLKDDPYRSLAGEVRKAGGYAKDVTPYTEFLWADFFRPHFGRSALRSRNGPALPEVSVSAAVALARSPQAHFLPGWSGAETSLASRG